MKKCPFNVSSRSYDKFVKRIESVIADEDARRRMIAAMQLYLAGYTDRCMEQLDDAERMAFEMLRFELDEAMRRSVRARESARRRKAAAEGGEVCQASSTLPADGVPDPSTRRRRYAEAMAESLEAYARAAGRELPAGAVEAFEKEIDAPVTVRKSRRQRRAETRRAGAAKSKTRWRAIG
ncbi:MAG: hypothetical protein K1V72_10490 [Duncaniella sp.]|jgi:hypothetical protein